MNTLIHNSVPVFKKIAFTLLFLSTCLLAMAQLNSTSSQTISTSQTYTGASTISNNSTVTVSGGITTFTGSLTVGNATAGSLIIKTGATVIVNGLLTIGTTTNGSVVVQNGGKLIVNPGASSGTAAISVNSTATTAFDIQSGGSVIVNAGSVSSLLGLYETAASNVSIAGSMQIRGGGFKMDGTAQLSYTGSGNDTIIGPSNAGAYFTGSTALTVGSGVNLYVSGDLKHDSNSSLVINGNVYVNGNYQSGNNTANVTGTGTLSTSGSLDADSYQGSVFGQRYSCTTGPCSGNNLISSNNTNTCSGGVVAMTGVAISGATYQWLVSTTSATSGFSNVSGATAQNYTATGSSSVQYTYYKRQYTLSGQTYNSNTLTITSAYWSNAPTVAAISGTNTICAGGTTTLTDATAGGVWSSATTSAATISSSGVVTGVAAGTSVISYTVTSGGCSGAQNYTVTVSGSTTITSQPVANTICAGSNTSFTVAATGAGLTYIWKENGANLSNGGIYSGATSATLTLTGATSAQDNKSYSVFVQGTCGSVLSNSAVLTVNSVPSVTAKTATTCSGTAFSVTPTGVPAGTTYTWTAPSGTSFTGGSAQASGQTSIGQTLTNTSTSAVIATYTVTPTSSCGAGSAFTVSVTVNPATAIAAQPAASAVCAGATTAFSVSATGLGLTYMWKESGVNLSDGGIYSGTSTATLTLTGVTSAQNNKSYSVFVQGTCGSVLSSSGLLTVTPAPTVVSGTNFSTCATSGAVNITAGASATNYSSIAWSVNGTGTIANPNSLTTATYTPSASDISAGSKILTLTASGNGTCTNVTSTKTITINQVPTATAGGSQSVCHTATATVSGASASNGTIAWTEDGAGSITSGATTLTPVYTPTSADIGNTVTLTMTVSNAPCASATATYTVTVYGGQITTTLSASGTYTMPAGAKAAVIKVWGAGGGGSKGYSNLKGTGGGGGGYAQKTIPVTAGDVVTVTVGTGGTGATVSGNGNAGAASTASIGSTTITATGGAGGQSFATPSGSGGAGGTGSGGDLSYSGGNGSDIVAPNSASPGGGAGASAGTAANGNNAGNTTPGSGSSGGTAVTGGGAGGDGGVTNANGAIGGLPGGGGGGNAGTGNGGNGANGQVTIVVYYTKISYSATSFCKTVTSDIPTVLGITGGTFSSSSGLSIVSATGEINPGTSTAGTYTVSYSTSCGVISTTTVKITAAPTAVAGTAVATCSSTGAVNITAGSSAANYANVSWTVNGTGTITNAASLTTATYTPSAADITAGSRTLTLTAAGNGTCASVTSTKIVTITAPPTVVAGTSVATCSSTGAVNITAGSSSTNNSGTNWTCSGTGTFANPASLTTATYTPSAADITAGSVTLTLTAIANGTCTNATSTKTITITKAASVASGTAVSTCASTGAVSITAGSSAADYNTITWTSNGTGTIANAGSLTNATYTPSATDISAGSKTLTLTATGNGTCPAVTSTKTITINGQPSVTLGTYPSICAGQASASVAYTSPVNSPDQYSINWSDAANAAGITDVAYSTLSGGTIPLTGLTSTAGVYGAVIMIRNSTTGCETICAASSLCGVANEGGYIMMTAPGNGTFAKVTFASYGTPTGSCPTLSTSACNAANSVSIVEAASLGKNTFSVDATNTVFGNPCGTTAKTLKISVLYSSFVLTVKNNPAITSTVSSGRCGTGAVTIRAAASDGSVLWYTAAASGSSIYTGENYTIPSLSSTTTYYVEAVANGCKSASRTPVTATINICAVSWTGATSTAWTTASNWSYGFVPAASDTAIIPTGVPYYPVIATTMSVYKLRINSGASVSVASTGTLNVYGDLINEGTLSTVAGSTVAFKGNTAQKITGVPVLYNAVINNTAGVALQSPLTVNGTLSLSKGVLTTNSNLTINFDNGGNIGYSSSDLGSISGMVTGRRDTVVAKTHYIGAPFSGVTSAQVAATTPIYVSPYWKMYSRTFSSQNWAAVTNSTTAMPLGTGFSLSLPATAPLVFTGTYDHTFALTGPAYPNTATGKYLLVANPYPSTIDWDNASGWTKTNVGDAVYYWDAANNRVASYVAGVGVNGATRYIPPMQAVLVGLTGTGGNSSVSVNNDARVNNQNPTYLRTAADVVIRILIQDSSATKNDETVIRFNENATNAFDQQFDAHKIINNALMPSLYTTAGSELYSINSYASPDSAKFIPLAAKLPADGKYILTITNDDQTYEYVLVDKKLGVERTIKEAYTFNGLKADDVNRFELQLRVTEATTGTGTTVTTGIQPASKAGGVAINSSTRPGFYIQTQRYAGMESMIEILDVTGNSITTISNKNLEAGNTFVPLDLPDGSYIVKVHLGAEIYTGMIVLIK
ncbi:MAG: beta strand repeat-containing protein [Cytophaga sp.]|uniref:beta strand repeat-containing protein n=1 Tax=Cytophaga sp. TaxID=29535 RepID=UPI003F7F0ECC